MSGTRAGALKASKTNRKNFGEDFYKRIGAIGGRAKVEKGFAVRRDLASKCGRIGGLKSKRKKREEA